MSIKLDILAATQSIVTDAISEHFDIKPAAPVLHFRNVIIYTLCEYNGANELVLRIVSNYKPPFTKPVMRDTYFKIDLLNLDSSINLAIQCIQRHVDVGKSNRKY